MLVGSAARGWSNARSDYDFYVVGDKPWQGGYRSGYRIPLDPPEVLTESFYFEGRRWEATNWLARQVDQIIAKVSWNEFENRIPGQILTVREEALLERLLLCVPVAGEDWIAQRQAEIKASAFKPMVITRSLGTADDAVEDALGQVESGDLDNAVLSARRALGHSIDALLEQHDQFGSAVHKWRPNRFRAADPAILSFERYWEMETMRTFDPEHPEKWITDVLTMCQEISMKVEI
jgi:hypothetical protein